MNKEQNMKRRLRALALILAPALIFAACTSPASETKAPEGVSYSVVIEGQEVTADNLDKGVKEALEQLVQNGNTKDGQSADNTLVVSFGGGDLRLSDESSMYKIFAAVENYYVHLDLSGVPGPQFSYMPILEAVDKTKILSIKFSDKVTRFRHATSFPYVSGTTGNVKYNNVYTTDNAFKGFSRLQSISAPGLEILGTWAFSGCGELTSVDLPKVNYVGERAFNRCTKLETLTLPKADNIITMAFFGCTKLASVDLPELVTIVGANIFENCIGLARLNLPKIGNIAAGTFSATGALPLEITVGAEPPVVGNTIFAGITSEKAVTVKRPADSTDLYGATTASSSDSTVSWANGLRGKGWTTGSVLGSGTQNDNITVTLVDSDPVEEPLP